AKVTEGSRVLLTGAGAIGGLNAQAARAHGASEIVISDPVENLRRFAEAHGASRAVDPMQTDFAQFEEHFDCYIDDSGNARAIDSAIPTIRHGVIAVLMGMGVYRLVLVKS